MTGNDTLIIISLVLIIAIFLYLTYQSGMTSKKVVVGIAELLLKIFRPRLQKETQEYAWALDNTQFYMRKAAHFAFFLVMTFLILSLFPTNWSVGVMVFVAVGSELIKVVGGNGRHPEIIDMILNTVGVVAGSMIVL